MDGVFRDATAVGHAGELGFQRIRSGRGDARPLEKFNCLLIILLENDGSESLLARGQNMHIEPGFKGVSTVISSTRFRIEITSSLCSSSDPMMLVETSIPVGQVCSSVGAH